MTRTIVRLAATGLVAIGLLGIGLRGQDYYKGQGGPIAGTVAVVGSAACANPITAGYSFTGDPDTGVVNPNPNELGFCIAATQGMALTSTAMIATNAFPFGWSATSGGNVDVFMTRNSAGQVKINNIGSTAAVNFNLSGAPALSACNDGALATGSTNTSGRVTSATTMTGCTLTFSTAFPNNSADCHIENLVANRGNVTAASTSAFTVANLTAGDDFMYFCVGR